MSKKTLFDYVTTQFLICEEKKPNNGEDSGLAALGEHMGIASVFDGCGGLGAMTYPARAGKTGAYMASRAVANAVLQWFAAADEGQAAVHVDELRTVVDNGLRLCAEGAGAPALRIKGSMVRAFPSTMAAIVYHFTESEPQRVQTTHIWAGDSRTYLLTPRGLVLVSEDDVKGEDALSNLTHDGILTNVLSADKPYTLHQKSVELYAPMIALSATDGCFGYLTSPMMFEAILLETMLQADSVSQWEASLRGCIADYAGDDFTLALTAFGFKSFSEMKEAYGKRLEQVRGVCDEFEEADENRKNEIWKSYQKEYYKLKGRSKE